LCTRGSYCVSNKGEYIRSEVQLTARMSRPLAKMIHVLRIDEHPLFQVLSTHLYQRSRVFPFLWLPSVHRIVMSSLVNSLPREIFRLVFEYLLLDDMREVDNAFMNSELRPLYLSQLSGLILKDEVALTEKLSCWFLFRNILVTQPFFEKFSYSSLPLLSNSQSVITQMSFMNSETAQFFPFLKDYPFLDSFSASSCGISDKLFENFLSLNPRLTCLIVSDENELSAAAVTAIIRYCENLEELDVSRNEWFTDESLLQLIQGCPILEYLDISDTGVTRIESIHALLDAHPLQSLLCRGLPLEIERLCLRQVLLPSVMSNDRNRRGVAFGSMMAMVDMVSHSPFISDLL
jgi:hypothetical protein